MPSTTNGPADARSGFAGSRRVPRSTISRHPREPSTMAFCRPRQQFVMRICFSLEPSGSGCRYSRAWQRRGCAMRRIVTSLSTGLMQRIRHFGDFVTVPLAIAVFLGLAGMYRLPLVLVGAAAWTLLEYLVHRFVFHRHSVGQRLHQLHHDHPSDPDAERSSLSTPLLAFPVGLLLIHIAGVQDGSAIFAGLLIGYLVFIYVHYAVHRRPIPPASWLYSAKM